MNLDLVGEAIWLESFLCNLSSLQFQPGQKHDHRHKGNVADTHHHARVTRMIIFEGHPEDSRSHSRIISLFSRHRLFFLLQALLIHCTDRCLLFGHIYRLLIFLLHRHFHKIKPLTHTKACFYFFWCCLLCSLKASLDPKVLSQRLQGMMIPSRWFASM